MRRARAALVCVAALLALAAAPAARAAAPAVASPEATDIQGVSALLKGTVDPGGLATTYRFQYLTDAAYAANGNTFAGAASTPATTAGSGSAPVPARAAISGLAPATGYRFRLLATNGDGTNEALGAFATTAGFGFKLGTAGFAVDARADGAGAARKAGSHPYQLSFTVGLREGGEFEGQPGVAFPDGDLRDLRIEMPDGLLLNPSVVAQCPISAFHTPRTSPFEAGRSGESCPDRSQVGTVEMQTSFGGGETRRFGVFNLAPAPGVAAQLGFAPYGAHIVLDTTIRAGEDGFYALTLEASDVPQRLDFHGLELALWGVPWAASHDGERGDCLNEAEPLFPWAKCSVGEPAGNTPLALLTMPTACSEQLAFRATATSWQQPAQVTKQALNRDPAGGSAAPVSGCGELDFDPGAEGVLSTRRASTSSGYAFRILGDDPGLTDPGARLLSQTERAVVRLPDGVTLNPSLGAGLDVCERGEYAAETAFSPQGAGCPNGSKIGDFRVRTQLYDGYFEGAVYLAKPRANPFGSLLAVYLVAKSPERGIMVRLPGELVPNPGDGTITAIFDGLPQLPYTDLQVNFRSGQRAPLISPPHCGGATTRIEMSPWAGEASTEVVNIDTRIETGIGGGSCPSGTPPFAPGAVAGGVNANVGSYTPYFVHLSRRDTEQEITSYSLVLPKGITGKLAGIPFCSEASIAAARAHSGFAEIARPSCPAASQVGSTLTGYGVGAALTYAPGRIYLAGPYQGQPLSLVTVNAATVGPFDLGTIVIRSAFSVNPVTAQLQIEAGSSDPIPHILEGIPLHLRDVRIYIDRFRFTRNPTGCQPSELVSVLTGSGARFADSSDDSTATVRKHFQLLNCLDLGYRPRLGLQLLGGVRRSAYPALRAVLSARPGDASMKRIAVTMPKSLFLAQNHIRTVCTRAQFAAERCPRGSIYGRAVVHSSLFDEPLRGPVLLRSSDNVLPDLVASLRSGEVRIVLRGRIGPSKSGGVRALFAGVPDAPIERFVMQLNGGRRGLLVNSVNVCNAPPKATVKSLGQNNRGVVYTTKLRGKGCTKFRAKQRQARKRRRRIERRRRSSRRGAQRASLSSAIDARRDTR